MHVVRRNLLDHWREFYSNTLHSAPAAACRDRDPASTSAVPDDNISSDPPTLKEISKAIQRLKN